MEEIHDVAESLTDEAEGSCRDVNFDEPTWEGVDTFVHNLNTSFKRVSASDDQGQTLVSPVSASRARENGSVHLVFEEGSELLRRLQVFVRSEENGSPFVELTTAMHKCAPSIWALLGVESRQNSVRICAALYLPSSLKMLL